MLLSNRSSPSEQPGQVYMRGANSRKSNLYIATMTTCFAGPLHNYLRRAQGGFLLGLHNTSSTDADMQRMIQTSGQRSSVQKHADYWLKLVEQLTLSNIIVTICQSILIYLYQVGLRMGRIRAPGWSVLLHAWKCSAYSLIRACFQVDLSKKEMFPHHCWADQKKIECLAATLEWRMYDLTCTQGKAYANRDYRLFSNSWLREDFVQLISTFFQVVFCRCSHSNRFFCEDELQMCITSDKDCQ